MAKIMLKTAKKQSKVRVNSWNYLIRLMLNLYLPLEVPSPGSDTGFQSRGCEFEPQLGKHSFRCLTKVIVTSVIRLPPFVFHQSMWKSSQLLGKIVVCITGVRKPGNTLIGKLAAVI